MSKTVSSIGEKAKVRVDVKKTASAHDLRRAFGERWAARLMPALLMAGGSREPVEGVVPGQRVPHPDRRA